MPQVHLVHKVIFTLQLIFESDRVASNHSLSMPLSWAVEHLVDASILQWCKPVELELLAKKVCVWFS